MMNSKELCDKITYELMKLKYNRKSDIVGSWKPSVIDEDNETLVRETILSILNENQSEHLGILEAKVKFYEEVISKSNFKPFLESEGVK